MQRSTSVTGEKSTTVLRYELVPGRTVRFEVELDLLVDVQTEDQDDRLHAEITGDFDFEVVRVDGGTALVRLHPRNIDYWVKSDSSLDEEAVSEPLAGLPPAFLLDPRGNTSPLQDTTGKLLLRPDDTNAAPFIVEALFPLYAEEAVEPGDEWEVLLDHGTRARMDPGHAQCAYVELEQDEHGHQEPVIRHAYAYEWRLPEGQEGATAYQAITRVAARDGWPRQVEGQVEIRQRGSVSVVRIRARRLG